ncbi:DNRLRE domain-containing protein, partial [Candidatus Woesearchaeota archaeon]|nr:DNRLRE domain-containing protein [Candidatus Woesearchaeota archaeon]
MPASKTRQKEKLDADIDRLNSELHTLNKTMKHHRKKSSLIEKGILRAESGLKKEYRKVDRGLERLDKEAMHADIGIKDDEFLKSFKNAGYGMLAVIVLLILGMFLVKTGMTGFAISGEAYPTYVQSINANITEPGNKTWVLENTPQEFRLTSVKLSGLAIGEGTVKAYLQDGNGNRYLLLDNSKLRHASIDQITGLAVAVENMTAEEAVAAEPGDDETQGPPPADKKITTSLEYGNNPLWDSNNDGTAYKEDGVIDFSVANTEFNWNIAQEKLCTKWTISSDNNQDTVLCNGNSECCALAGVAPEQEDWDAQLYLFYGRYGSTDENTVSAQVIFLNQSLDEDIYFESVLGETVTLDANFIQRPVFLFTDACKETCTLRDGLNSSEYTLVFEMDPGTHLFIDNITYSIEDLSTENDSAQESNANATLISYAKVKTDSRYDAIVDETAYENTTDTLTVVFHHNSPTPLPISVKGKVNYTLDRDVSVTGQNVTLKVYNWGEKRFRIVVGDHTEVLEFGHPEKVAVQASVKNSRGLNQRATVRFYDPVLEETVAEKTDGETAETIDEGEYDIELTLPDTKVKKVAVRGAQIYDDTTEFIRLEDLDPQNTREDFVSAYAIDPTPLNFTDATVTVTATGDKLYKCANWSFEEQECTDDSWIFIQDVVPGQNYTFTLTQDDPAYGETLQPDATEGYDTFVNQNAPNQNYGDSEFLVAAELSGNYAGSLLYFNLSNITGADVSNAVLRLYYYEAPNNPANAINISVRRIQDVWDEATVTWNNKPASGSYEWAANTLTDNYGWIEWNITDLVQSWANGTWANRGIALTPDTVPAQTQKRFYSSDSTNAAYRPQLMLNYSIDDVPPDVDLTWPLNDTEHGDGKLTFIYNASDADSEVTNCSLIGNGTVVDTDNTITEGILQRMVRTVNDEKEYEWRIACTDTAGNTGTSETRTLRTNLSKADLVSRIRDSDENVISADIILYQGGVQKYSSSGETHTLVADDGTYNITIIPSGAEVQTSTFYNVNLDRGISRSIDLDTVNIANHSEYSGYNKVYAIDPSEMNFTSATITVTADSTPGNSILFKCADWNFTTEDCQGSWTYLMQITAGQQYNVTLNPADPGLAEGSGTFFDGFESGNLATKNWTNTGAGAAWTVGDPESTPYAGSYNIRVENTQGASILETNIDTTNYTGIVFSFYAKTAALDTGEYVAAGWYNGTGWTDVMQVQTIAAYTFYNYSLPAAANNNALFRIRFRCSSDSNNEDCQVDNVQVTGTFAPPGDTTPPGSVTGLTNRSAGSSWIYWNWTNPADIDFSAAIIYINGTNVANSSNNYYNATGLASDTTYTITVHTKDTNGNVNTSDVNSTARTAVAVDTTPPASITNLQNISAEDTWIQWNWTNPLDADFNSSIVYINGTNVANTSDDQYTASGLKASTDYRITIHTKDNNGNVNTTNVNNTARTTQSTASFPFFDGFESGTFTAKNWTLTTQGIVNWTTSSSPGDVYAGMYAVKATNTDGRASIQNSISTQGFKNINFSFMHETLGLDIDDEFFVEWYNGTGWTVLLNLSGTGDISYTQSNYSLGTAANNNPLFAIRFTCNVNTGTERCNIDNVRVTGVVADTSGPEWSSNRTRPASGATYSPGAAYQFNVTWTDNTSVHTVRMEHNFTGTLQNYSVTGNSSGEYYYNYTDLAAGTYAWRMHANDSYGYLNATPIWTYVVGKAASTTSLYLNGSQANRTLTYSQSSNATATTDAGSVTLYRNGTPVSNPEVTTLPAGLYNYTAINIGDTNHTGSSATWFLTVNKNAASVQLLLNGTDSNLTIERLSDANITASLMTGDNVPIYLYRNGTLINSGMSPISNISQYSAQADYNITAAYAASQNYSSSSETHWLLVRD